MSWHLQQIGMGSPLAFLPGVIGTPIAFHGSSYGVLIQGIDATYSNAQLYKIMPNPVALSGWSVDFLPSSVVYDRTAIEPVLALEDAIIFIETNYFNAGSHGMRALARSGDTISLSSTQQVASNLAMSYGFPGHFRVASNHFVRAYGSGPGPVTPTTSTFEEYVVSGSAIDLVTTSVATSPAYDLTFGHGGVTAASLAFTYHYGGGYIIGQCLTDSILRTFGFFALGYTPGSGLTGTIYAAEEDSSINGDNAAFVAFGGREGHVETLVINDGSGGVHGRYPVSVSGSTVTMGTQTNDYISRAIVGPTLDGDFLVLYTTTVGTSTFVRYRKVTASGTSQTIASDAVSPFTSDALGLSAPYTIAAGNSARHSSGLVAMNLAISDGSTTFFENVAFQIA